jgi:hypothetical protein
MKTTRDKKSSPAPIFWIRFAGSLVFFGPVFGLIAVQLVDIMGIIPCTAIWAAFTIVISVYIARTGYSALLGILASFMP